MSSTVDPKHPDFIADPHAAYRTLRANAPVYWSHSLRGWVITRHDLVSSILLDQRFSVEKFTPFVAHMSGQMREKIEIVTGVLENWMVFRDPPQHQRLRGAIAKYFSSKEMERLRPRVMQVVNELIDSFAANGRVELIGEFAIPLPTRVIGELFGAGDDRIAKLKQWASDLGKFVTSARASPDKYDRAAQAVEEMVVSFTDLLDEHRRNPRPDLTTRLLEAGAGPEGLTQDEMISTLVLLLFAGHETTTNLIANGLYWLLREPQQLALLKADRSLIASSVEEILRYEGPVQTVVRLAKEDVRLGEADIHRGHRLFLAVNAAARDPAVFEDADAFRIDRPRGNHITFGLGIHFCLGAPLARLESQVALDCLLGRLDDLRLETSKPRWTDDLVTRGMEELHLSFRPTGQFNRGDGNEIAGPHS